MPTYSDDRIVPCGSGQYEDLTKREYFAAMAMQSLLCDSHYEAYPEAAAARAVLAADALIEELNKEKK